MNLRIIPLALRALTRNPLRSLFMMLGVAVGIASLTAMASVGESARQETMRQFKRMIGTFDTVSIQPGSARTRGMPSVTTVEPSLRFEDAQAIRTEIPGIREVAESMNAFDIDVKYRDRSTATAIFGASANWLQIRFDEVTAGNSISEEDVQTLARVALIGEDVRDALFAGEDPLGKTLRIAEVPFQVKGILASRGAGPGGASLDDLIVIPVTTASRRLFNRDYLTSITVQVQDPLQAERTVEQIAALLRERHGIVPPVEDDFTISNPRAAMDRVTEVGSTLSTVLTGVAVIATLIGGTVIMSLMLIAVSERRREIGVRRAVGATRGNIMGQFLAEAAVVSVIGGIVGVLFGVTFALIAAFRQELQPALSWTAIGVAVALSVGIGLVFGLQPAWKAANVDPIQALRS